MLKTIDFSTILSNIRGDFLKEFIKMIKKLMYLLLVVIAAGFAGCNNDENNNVTGGQVTITSISITAVSRGQQNAEASILGTNFTGATSVSMGDGITVNSINTVSATEIRIVFSVDINTTAGPRTITVTTSTSTGSAAALLEVLTNRVPVAKFTVDPPAGSTSTTFTFDASNSTDPDNNLASYLWFFGNEGTGQGKKVTKKFNSVAEYVVVLTVSDHSGASSRIERVVEISKNSPPVARIKVTPNEGSTFTEFEFDGSGSTDPDGKIVSYGWKFGDGRRAQGVMVSHTFEKEGKYSVELKVTDNKGQEGGSEREINVEKSKGVDCNPRTINTGEYYVLSVISQDRAKHQLLVRFSGNPGCRAFFRCGDIRKGGFPGVSPGSEYWIGTMCKFIDFGDGTALITTEKGRYWPENGESRLYAWPQECGPLVSPACRNGLAE